jgi:hypothetical protein
VKKISSDKEFAVETLRFLQTLLMILTHDGELLLNCELFPYLISFLNQPHIQELILSDKLTVVTWYNVCVRYLSFVPNSFSMKLPESYDTPCMEVLNHPESQSIPLLCNCIRSDFPR